MLVLHGSSALTIALLLFMYENLTPSTALINNIEHLNKGPSSIISISAANTDHGDFGTLTLYFFVMLVIQLLLLLSGSVHPNPGPVDMELDGLSAIHINARSLMRKIPLVQCEAGCFDIITVSETWFSDATSDNDILIPGFQPPIRRDRPGDPHGGVAVYLKSNLVCKPRPELCVPDLEAVWVETKLGQKTLLLGTFYRPPDAHVNYWNLVDQSIQLAGNTPHPYIILGDFNADCTNRIPPHLQHIISTNNLYQLVNKPTRITEHTSTIIDLILTPCPDLIKYTDVLPPVCSVHSCPYIVLKHKNTPRNSHKRTIFNYSKLDVLKLTTELMKVDWERILSLESIDEAAEKVSDELLSLAKLCMPVKEVKTDERDAPWITLEIKKLMKKKNEIHKLAKHLNSDWTWALFRRVRNDLTDKIRNRKTHTYLT